MLCGLFYKDNIQFLWALPSWQTNLSMAPLIIMHHLRDNDFTISIMERLWGIAIQTIASGFLTGKAIFKVAGR